MRIVMAWSHGTDVPALRAAHPDIEIVVNLTIPTAHADVDLQCIAAGKHVWSEKPYAVTREEAHAVEEAAKKAGVLVCVAPQFLA